MIRHIGTVVLAGVFAAGCGGSDSGPSEPEPPPQTLEVTMHPDVPRFVPAIGTVAAGGEVTFTNTSAVVHDVVTGSNRWESMTLQPGESFSVTLEAPGPVPYVCTLHEQMTGQIIVE